MPTLELSDAEAGQLALHARTAARAAAAGDHVLACSEAMLAWAILAPKLEAYTDTGTLVQVEDRGRPTRAQLDEAVRLARDAAAELIGHFVGEERYDVVEVYERITDELERIRAAGP